MRATILAALLLSACASAPAPLGSGPVAAELTADEIGVALREPGSFDVLRMTLVSGGQEMRVSLSPRIVDACEVSLRTEKRSIDRVLPAADIATLIRRCLATLDEAGWLRVPAEGLTVGGPEERWRGLRVEVHEGGRARELIRWVRYLPSATDPAPGEIDKGLTAALALGTLALDAIELDVEALGQRLSHDPDPSSRAWAAWALGRKTKTPAEIVPALAKALEDPSARVRVEAVRALGALRAEAGWAHLIRALGDDDPVVRRAAAAAFGGTPPSVVVIDGIARALGDADPGVAAHGQNAVAAWARLARSGNGEARNAVLEIARRRPDLEQWIRRQLEGR